MWWSTLVVSMLDLLSAAPRCLSSPGCINGYRRPQCLRGNLVMDKHTIQGGVAKALFASCYANHSYTLA